MYDIPNSGPTPDNFDDVGMFHQKFGLDNTTFYRAGPRVVDPELMGFRIRFLLEELTEFMEAVGAEFYDKEDGDVGVKFNNIEIDHGLAFDALLDLAYVVFGTAHLLGYPWEEGWTLVQTANMMKIRAQEDGSDSKRGSSFDVVKPEGWRPPDVEGLLKSYGWKMPDA